VCKYKEVLERFVRGGYDANSRQRAPADPLRGGSKSKPLLEPKCIPPHTTKSISGAMKRKFFENRVKKIHQSDQN
jgi:hypothetical protein